MKRFSYGIMIAATMLFVSGCGATAPRHMMFKEDPSVNIFNLKPESGKAALVVARTVSFGGAIDFYTYLDKKLIGVTQWKSYFVKTDVTPGKHYVISQAESIEPVKINFEQGRVYYILQVPRLGVWRARVSAAPLLPQQLSETFDSNCRLVALDVNKPGDDLSDKDYNEAVSDYEREVKEGRHQDHLNYKGVPAK